MVDEILNGADAMSIHGGFGKINLFNYIPYDPSRDEGVLVACRFRTAVRGGVPGFSQACQPNKHIGNFISQDEFRSIYSNYIAVSEK